MEELYKIMNIHAKKNHGCVFNHFSTKAVRVLARSKVIVDIRLFRDVSTLRGPVGMWH